MQDQDLITQHVECATCGYDLHLQTAGDVCPECGRRIPDSKAIREQKNPRRVRAQHRALVREAKREFRLSVTVCAVFVALSMLAIAYRWHLAIAVPLVSVTGVMVLDVFVVWSGVNRARERLDLWSVDIERNDQA